MLRKRLIEAIRNVRSAALARNVIHRSSMTRCPPCSTNARIQKNTQAESPVIKLNTNKNLHQAFVTEVLCTPSAEMTQQHPQAAHLCALVRQGFRNTLRISAGTPEETEVPHEGAAIAGLRQTAHAHFSRYNGDPWRKTHSTR